MLVDHEALHEFIDESLEALESVEGGFIKLEKDPGNSEIINAIFRPIHSIKGSSGFFGLTNINKFSHRLENLLDQVRRGELELQRELVDILLQGVETLEQMLLRIRQDPAATTFSPEDELLLLEVENYCPAPVGGTIKTLIELQQLLQDAVAGGVDIYSLGPVGELLNKIERAKGKIAALLSAATSQNAAADSPGRSEDRLGDILVAQQKISREQLDLALSKQKKLGEILMAEGTISPTDLQRAVEQQTSKLTTFSGGGKTEAADKTIRISQAKIDQFAESIGELFINLDSFNYLKKLLESSETSYELMAKFTGTVSTFDDMVSELHDSVMEIRKVPFNTLVQRFPKVVRQLAASVKKDIDLVVRGEETVIDKDLIEKIENPLVHILRNSIDHGVEPPERRLALGKKRQGLIEISARVDEDFAYITIGDDGAGISPEKMKQVALKKGLAPPEELERYSDNQLINLIFAPGFSSAEKVSDISGRGVGMDVVLSGLRECNGEIDVNSTINRGTTISLKIPLTKTLVAKDAMIIQVAEHLFAIDSRDIDTTIEANVRINELVGEQRTIQVNGKPHRVIDLRGLFFPDEDPKREVGQPPRVFVVSDSLRLALLADQVLSHQKIVVKDFRKSYAKLRTIRGISGYSILGNQDIALIIDFKGLAKHSGMGKDWQSLPGSRDR